MEKIIASLCLLAGLWGFQACTAPRDTQQSENMQLVNSAWTLVSMAGELPENVSISLSFEAERLSGKGVCNRYFAGYTATEGQLSVQAVGATRMMCPAHAETEARYFDWLGKAETYAFSGDQLTIATQEGELVFSKEEAGN